MAQYKVPQDVEADDKLIGPFSFRQFIYLIIVTLSIMLGYGLAQLFVPLAIIPLPIVLLFGALALPLRKDQPMEMFMAAMVSFFLKPHLRLWDPDGIDAPIEITVPKTVEFQRTKGISQSEAQSQLGYLAEIVDSQGWAVRGAGVQAPNSAMNSDAYFAAQQVQDVLDGDNSVAQTLDYKLNQSDINRRQEMMNIVNGQPSTKTQPVAPQSTPSSTFDYFGNSTTSTSNTAPEPIVGEHLDYDPYPDEIVQAVVQSITSPIEPITKPSLTTSEKVVPAGIIDLANREGLSIATVAREANRINAKQDLNQEVIISLR